MVRIIIGEIMNDIWSSSNGVDWEQVTGNAGFLPKTAHAVFTVDGKIFVYGGIGWNYSTNYISDDLWYSSDGKLWTLVTWQMTGTPRIRAKALVFNGKVWLLGGATDTGDSGYATNDVFYAD